MKFILAFLFLFISQLSFAHTHPNCTNYQGNSCWFANNKSQGTVSISCKDSYQSEFKTQLNSDGNYSYQFCDGWGDGMGYPETGVASDCAVQYQSGKNINFRIAAIDWGNRVDFVVNESNVAVSLTTTWFQPRTVSYVFK